MSNIDLVNYDSPGHGVTWSSKLGEVGVGSLYKGKANTKAIMKAYPEDTPENNAAWLCHEYDGGGYRGWYLPARIELDKIYEFVRENNLIGKNCKGKKKFEKKFNNMDLQCLIGGCGEGDGHKKGDIIYYWSSSEYEENASEYACIRSKYLGLHKTRGRAGVRAIRVLELEEEKEQDFNRL